MLMDNIDALIEETQEIGFCILSGFGDLAYEHSQNVLSELMRIKEELSSCNHRANESPSYKSSHG